VFKDIKTEEDEEMDALVEKVYKSKQNLEAVLTIIYDFVNFNDEITLI
jgi:hypothetical protein